MLQLGAWVLVASVALSSTKKVPPAEREEVPCTHWQGTVSGNDPSVRVTVILCPLADHRVTGTLVWESKQSGTNTRTLDGTQSGKSFTLRDLTLDGNPTPGWRFCKIDRYALALVGDAKLEGTYHSSACNDDATVKLQRVR
jgi:hypothetical protein